MADNDFAKILRLVDPMRLMNMQQEEEQTAEDQAPLKEGSLKLYKYVYRLLERWRYEEVIIRNGGVTQSAYLGDIDDEQVAAEAVIAKMEAFFRPPMRLKYEIEAYPRKKRGATRPLEETETDEPE